MHCWSSPQGHTHPLDTPQTGMPDDKYLRLLNDEQNVQALRACFPAKGTGTALLFDASG